jgi:hypothetical protein
MAPIIPAEPEEEVTGSKKGEIVVCPKCKHEFSVLKEV